MKKKILKTATVVAKVDPRKPLPTPVRTRVQAPTKAKLVAALKKLHPMD